MQPTVAQRLLAGVLPMAVLAFAADAPSQFPYCENKAQSVSFDPQGAWTLTAVAASSETPSLARVPKRRLIGSQLVISRETVQFWNKRAMSWKKPFPTPLLWQQSYDTRSREFWLDFRTDPKDLNLPHYVSAVNVELGTVLAAGPDRVYFDYSGVWFRLARTNGSTGQKH